MPISDGSLQGMNLMKARAEWVARGGFVYSKRCTGEDVYGHPEIPKRIVVNRRRKDAPRALTSAIRRLRAARMKQWGGDVKTKNSTA